jgi:type II secretory ATPase GspE/PulE/Tfp pilus assembly ATPase PilB-like protein
VPEAEKEDKKVLDQSISSLEDLIDILYKKKYDFFTIIPSEELTEISFKKDNKLEETRYISYKIYTKILIRVKTLAKMDMEIDNEEQKKEFEMNFKQEKIKTLAKTAPSKD